MPGWLGPDTGLNPHTSCNKIGLVDIKYMIQIEYICIYV